MDPDVSRLPLAVLQQASAPGDVSANLSALDAAAAEASERGAALLITPEMFLSGYAIGDDIPRLAAADPLEQVREIARRHRLALIAGGPEQVTGPDGTAVHNAAWFVDEDGRVLGRHHKIQLFGGLDRRYFTPGRRASTLVRYRGFTIALLICFDVEYPEAARAAALAGADLIAVPTAQMEPFSFVNDHVIRVRAWENSVYVAYVNQTGRDGDFEYVGRSVVADPFGQHLAEAGRDDRALLVAELDREVIERARVQNPYLAEVRSELYRH